MTLPKFFLWHNFSFLRGMKLKISVEGILLVLDTRNSKIVSRLVLPIIAKLIDRSSLLFLFGSRQNYSQNLVDHEEKPKRLKE